MKVKDNVIYAEPGMIFRRKSDLQLCGAEYWLGYLYYLAGKKLDEPILEKPEDFEEVSEELPEILDRQYRESQYPILVDSLIKLRYNQSSENAILRQRDTKPEEFKKYFEYCEECKKRAKEQLGLLDPEPEIEEPAEESPENQEETE